MKKIPSQFYMYAIVLCCYHWPWYLSLLDENTDALLTVLLLQSALLISCTKLVAESWKYALILIEAFCMLFNVTLFLLPSMLLPLHDQLMLWALIIELLIITISTQGSAIGISLPMACHSIRDIRRAAFYRDSCARASQ